MADPKRDRTLREDFAAHRKRIEGILTEIAGLMRQAEFELDAMQARLEYKPPKVYRKKDKYLY